MKPHIFVEAWTCLSEREKEVLGLIAGDGLSNEAISRKLKIAKSTVETHRARGLRSLSQYAREDIDLRLFTSLWWQHVGLG